MSLALSDGKDLITGSELDRGSLLALLDRAAELKAGRAAVGAGSLAGRSVALVFERPSTRTRVSFEVGVAELGGTPLVLRAEEMQLTRGESVADTGRVLSRYLHAIVIRSGSDERVAELAEAAQVPVVNALTPLHHPCQALADLMTLRERFGELEGLRLAYLGDGNNVARSLLNACVRCGVSYVFASPAGYGLDEALVESAGSIARQTGATIEITADPAAAVTGADVIYTDVWTSMGQEAERQQREQDFAGFQVNAALVARARPDAVVLHCLPAYRNLEITDQVIDGPQSRIFEQAENRLHSQRALLELLLVRGRTAGRRVQAHATATR